MLIIDRGSMKIFDGGASAARMSLNDLTPKFYIRLLLSC